MQQTQADAVVVGGGHHGLVAAAILADAGWDVVLLEAEPELGGAVRSAELHPGFVTDRFSAFYPLAAASPVLRALELEEHGLRWAHAPAVLAHPPRPDGAEAAVLHRDAERTAAGLDAHHPGDGQAWLELCRQWQRIEPGLLRTLFTAFPPVRGPAELMRVLGVADALRLLRFALLPAARMGEELFGGQAARLLLAGNTAHADVPPNAPGSGVFGWLLAMLGQQHGFPTPVGGTGRLTAALASRAEAAGARLLTGERVERIVVRGGRAVAVETAGGARIAARRAVIADVSAHALYTRLLPRDAVPARLLDDLGRFVWDTPVVKIDWALSEPIPWRAKGVAEAGTVHLGADLDGLVRWSADLETGALPDSPFLLLGQMTTTDPQRSPAGTESAWAYSHLPRGIADRVAADELAERMEAVVEAHAPGFRERVLFRSVQRPSDLEGADANLVGGAVNGGTAQLFQQLVFRPVPGLGRPETPVERLYLGSAAAHPGGGVHGVCGFLAARAALGENGRLGPVRRRVTSAALALVHGR
ncbi:Phytoene dehydrogenase-related protein [Pseudonocardia thermophila]|uniref:Pyridine nucleotide-disulfide oxidoreductase domain-containing protein 2 n=1 Tax=Pseudonocardia thermophila TaxID=1848 RepID=A0A1M6XXF7_PSETH|nr:NAD(P)/FAD-dependent oxidoreductase [Pseudonocardia thermophila]SHL10586.1 Phytoene dehydrogenase-related protein [Pseudonocardia thermophila]